MEDYATSQANVTEGPEGAGGGKRRWLIASAAAVLVAVAVAVVALARDPDDRSDIVTRSGETTSQPSATSTPEAATSTTTSPPPTTAPTTVTHGPSAADSLDAFLTAAATLDEQLTAAAAAINAAGAPWSTISDELAATVEGAELRPVLEAIPAGLPPELLQPVILVTSDLASRRAAMESFTIPRAAGDPQPYDLLVNLANGHDAAQRFDADLAVAQAAALGHASVTRAAPSSRAAAELQLLIQYVVGINAGCDSRGGVVITSPPTITWQSDHEGTVTYGSSTVGFDAALRSDGTWVVHLHAC